MSIFLKGVVPQWEDPANKHGGEYQVRIQQQSNNPAAESTLDHLNRVWEALVQDLATRRFPNPHQILGARIVDKSFAGKETFRIEVWFRSGEENSEEVKAIRQFLDTEYNAKYGWNQNIAFKPHAH